MPISIEFYVEDPIICICEGLLLKGARSRNFRQFQVISGNFSTDQIVIELRWLETVSSTFQDLEFDGSLQPLFTC